MWAVVFSVENRGALSPPVPFAKQISLPNSWVCVDGLGNYVFHTYSIDSL